MWEQPGSKTAEQIKASIEAHRADVIQKYTDTLNTIEKEIKAAKETLKKVQQDIDNVHASRIDQYAMRESQLDILNLSVNDSIKEQTEKLKEIEDRIKFLNEQTAKEDERIALANVALSAKQDQLDALKIELDGYAQTQLEVAKIHDQINQEHKKRRDELDEETNNANKFHDEIIQKHHDLQEEIEKHKANVEELESQINHHATEQVKVLEFYEILKKREAELEPLKKQLQEGIEVNALEAKRLQDEKLENYGIKRDADQRIKIAIEAEQRTIAEMDKLNIIKNDIHANLKKEN